MKTTFTSMLPFGIATIMALCVSDAVANEFVADGLRYQTIDETTVTVKKYVEGTDIVIPSTVTDEEGHEYTVVSVGSQAFYNAPIATVKFPSTVTNVEQYAFWKSEVESVEFAEGLETIGYSAFKECQYLLNVQLPTTLKEVGAMGIYGFAGEAFSKCSGLQSIVIPGNITEVPDMTFSECLSLSDVTLCEGVETLGERVFEKCSSLKTIELPSTLTTMSRAAFNTSGLTSVTIPSNLTIIPNSAFLWCSELSSVIIDEGVVEVGKQSFADCPLITEVSVPNSVEWIRSDAFQGNGFVKTIHLGSGLRRLGNASLAVWQPSRDTNVPEWALTDIYILSPEPPYHEQNDDHFDLLEDDFFFAGKEFTDELRQQFYSEVTLHVPADAVEAYKSAVVWENFTNILGDADISTAVTTASATPSLTVADGVVMSQHGGITVYDSTGVIVASTTSTSLDLSGIASGLYIVKADGLTVKTVVK